MNIFVLFAKHCVGICEILLVFKQKVKGCVIILKPTQLA